MKEEKPKKVVVNDGVVDRSSQIKIKKERDSQRNGDEIREDVSRFYHKPFDHLERSSSLSGKSIFWLIILILIVGFLAGALGSIFIFSRDTIILPWGKELDLTKYFPEKQVIEVEEKSVTVSSDIRAEELIEKIQKSLVSIFPKKELGETPAFLEQIYAPWQIKSIGIIISPDGWILTSYPFEETNEQGGGGEEKWEIMTNQGEIYDLEKIVRDERTGLTFVQIADLDQINDADLPYLEIGSFSSINEGQTVLVVDKFSRWHISQISHAHWRDINKTEDIVRSTDYFSESILVDNISPNALPGSPIFNLKGELIALASSDNKKYIPCWQFEKSLLSLRENKEISYLSLGIDYLLIEEAPGLLSARFQDLKEGAIVYGHPLVGLPAYAAGLRNADVIIKFEDKNINKKNNLTYLVSQKSAGQTIHLTILRQGQEKEITIIP